MNETRAGATEAFWVYITASDETEARRIARAAVDEHLAACANMLGPVKSIYRWEGEVCEGDEVAFILKTSGQRKDELIERVRQLHSYECPCIICLPVTAGNPDFLNWIDEQTRE